MKRSFLLASLSICFLFSQAGTIVVEGKYQNKNIYIQNAYSQAGVGFCAYAVYVNGKLTNDEVNSTAFEIDLSQLQLKYGQDITIKIFHRDGCTPPRVLNPDALKPIPTFEVTAMKMTNDGLITWTAKNEGGSLPYIVEQFRWNKWVNVGEIQGVGTPGEHDYKFLVTALHSGENKFRLKQVGYQAKYSAEVKIVSSTPRCIFSTSKSSKQIDFTCGTLYEVYDYYGSVVKKGYGTRVDIANLQKGGYYVCFDNSIGELKKK
ncbi:MAG: hypothetical protein HY841_05050 [Bacteroidetes bacterium]|nr:hypothetical protein [Bacteroidota bacterium]